MARPRDFDLDRGVERAMQLFWSRGYAATSLRDLCQAMEISTSSFYAAFGSKDACFRRALERYLGAQRLPAEPSPAVIRAWFKAILGPRYRGRGCLLVISAVEGPNLEPATREWVQGRIRALEDLFRACLGARRQGREDAALLAGTVLAIHVKNRAGAGRAELRRMAQHALSLCGL